MIDPVTFFKALGIAIVWVLLLGAPIGWLIYLFKKYKTAIKCFFKYTLFRRAYNEKHVAKLLQYYDAKQTPEQITILMLTSQNPVYPKWFVDEMVYIYKKMIKLKGGSIK